MATVFDDDFARDPWPVLRALRDDGGVHRIITPDGPPAWLVTRYDGVRGGLLDDRLSTNLRYADGPDYRGFAVPAPLGVFQTSEPGDLARLRRPVITELRGVGEWSGRIPDLVDQLLRRLDPTAELDLVEQVAVPLPAAVLAQLLGLPADLRDRLLGWANSTLRPHAAPRARDTLAAMQEILAATLAVGRRVGPESTLGRLTGSSALNSGETVGLLFYLLFVWYEVLADAISGAVLALSSRPDQLDFLRSEPDRATAGDELLRYVSPQVLAGPRFATEDLDIGGQRISAGQTVLLCLASANHDEAVFRRPDELDLSRNPNPHLSFGHGSHACVSTGLVRPMLAEILVAIYTRWPGLRVTGCEPEIAWRSGFRHRGPVSLPVKPT
ncbi:cytochrome P450 [Nocardia stercoris]|uniref:Cytochrome P450 n=1 Tax=Nocardia stercoris TaxID=2483361 RepID=A0A3M2L9H7_9NOCA|nr:cytochrome P450 [Nocardia stercoris]RMI31228.1 cytochrome P450 [Nocardia stercoris]